MFSNLRERVSLMFLAIEVQEALRSLEGEQILLHECSPNDWCQVLGSVSLLLPSSSLMRTLRLIDHFLFFDFVKLFVITSVSFH